MEERKEYSPTLIEWDELVTLWNRSRVMFANTLATNVKARIAWVTKTFVSGHSDAVHGEVYGWLERNLEIAIGSKPVSERLLATSWHDEITAVHKIPRGTSHGHITTQGGADASFSVASSSGVHRQG